MNVISRKKLKDFWEKHPQSEHPLKAWFKEAEHAKWRIPQDIKDRYRSADFIEDNRVIFDLCGNKYRLIVHVNYECKIVYIKFIGTHAEYLKVNARTI